MSPLFIDIKYYLKEMAHFTFCLLDSTFVSLSVCMCFSICHSLVQLSSFQLLFCLSAYLFIHLGLYVCPAISLSVQLAIFLSVCLFASPAICLSVYLFSYLIFCLSVEDCLFFQVSSSIHLFVFLPSGSFC